MKNNLKYWLLFVASAAVVFAAGWITSTVMEHQSEAKIAYKPKVDVERWEPRNEVWGINFPNQYSSFVKTAESDFESKYHGNTVIDMLERHPAMVVLWAGYGFAKEYEQSRGHMHALTDIRRSLRTGSPGINDLPDLMPNTCWTCKSPDVPRVMEEIGVAEFYKGGWSERGHQISNPIGCADCHDAETMSLSISRPALAEAFRNSGQSLEKASHQDMRSLVCAQCHVEYYFDKTIEEGVPYLKFPWDSGMTVEAAEAYYDAIGFADWVHPLSKAPMLKAQHPGYEIYLTGIHARRGVSCADCHMPYKTEGGIKYSDHQVRSPLDNIANTCQVCHRESADELVATVYRKQDIVKQNRDTLEKQLVMAHLEAALAWELGATEAQMEPILMDIRHAQWRWDYAVASHGASFHSTEEVLRILSTGTSIAHEGRIKLVRLLATLGHDKPVGYPDIGTKEKAQEFLGMEMGKMKKDKALFLEEIVPKWEESARERENNWPVNEVAD